MGRGGGKGEGEENRKKGIRRETHRNGQREFMDKESTTLRILKALGCSVPSAMRILLRGLKVHRDSKSLRI